MRRTSLWFFSVLAFSLLCASCAQVVPITGGEQDVTPPAVVKSIPKNNSVNFHGNRIMISFNEYITLRELSSQLIISPPLKKTPEVKVKNKTLTIDLEDTLKENTTYTFNFGNSIVDFTENNPVDNYQFVLATGPFLDSLTVSGKVDKAFNHTTEKGVLVMLYSLEKASKDSFPYKELPDYFGKTNELGNYSINNVRSAKYKLFALKEGNINYLFDSEDEQIGFVDSVLDVSKPLLVDLSLFQEERAKLYLRKPVKSGDGLITLAFSRPVENISIEPLNPDQKFNWSFTEILNNKDTARFWYSGATGDSIHLKVLNNGLAMDTVEVRIPTKENNRQKGERDVELQLKTNASAATLDLNKKLVIQFQQPVKKYSRSRMKLSLRKDTIPFTLKFIDTLRRTAEITAKYEEDSTYKLLIPQGSFEDYTGLKNDTVRISFRVLTQREYGTLKLKVKLPKEGAYVLQLMDEKENLVNQKAIAKSEVVFYEYLKPGQYKFKLIEDLNSNQKWDTGRFLEKRQAETTKYFGTTLTVRSNWDLEEVWDLTK